MSSQKYAASIRQYTCSRENGSREKTQRIEPIFSNQIQFDSKIYRYHILSFTCTFRTTVWISRSHSTALCILIYCSRVALRYDGLSFSRALHMCVLSTIHLPLVLLFESMLNERWFFRLAWNPRLQDYWHSLSAINFDIYLCKIFFISQWHRIHIAACIKR